jgi:hypothetical protein
LTTKWDIGDIAACPASAEDAIACPAAQSANSAATRTPMPATRLPDEAMIRIMADGASK